MRLSITAFMWLLLCFFSTASAQNAKDITFPVTASVSLAPASITLNWPNPTPSGILVWRRTKGQAGNQWIQLYNQANSSLTTLTDNQAVALGQTYEYLVYRENALQAWGYAHVAVRAPVTDTRGKVLVFVDSTTADALGVELVRMKNDMRGDGWVTVPYKVGPSATPESVKAQIVAAYTAEPQVVRSVLLIGSVPVPYSGFAAWDGHPEHSGAWPADAFYGDVNGVWTDTDVNSDTSARAANINVPGDGKYDQPFIPSAVELSVGRIDFRRIDAAAFGEANTIGLIRRYLDKNHAYRTGAYTVEQKALVDDNFGFFGGEAFAANGFRNAYPVVGEANVVSTDFFDGSKSQKWLMGYGCGGGTYTSADGIGNSADFATDTVNIVFTNLFGSYFGDWDYENNPFMPAALASRGGVLTCSWVGRPHSFNHAFASGETIGYCLRESQNAQFNLGFYGSFGESGAHTSLLGDPTLRAHVIAPPTNITTSNSCSGVKIDWTASTENVDGYHVYRSLSNDGPYTRISSNVINDVTFIDNNPVEDTMFYQVRAIKTQVTPGGGIYLNNSVGPISFLVYTAAVPPVISLQGLSELTCANDTIALEVNSSKPVSEWAWEGPNGLTSSNAILNLTIPGNYKVVVTDENGCTAEAATFISQNTIPPVINVESTGLLTCLNTTATLSVTTAALLDETSYLWSNGATTPTVTLDFPQTLEVQVNSLENGCPGNAVFVQMQNIALPEVDIPAQLTYNCTDVCASVVLVNNPDYEYSLDLQPINAGVIEFCNAGTYAISTLNTQNGCAVDNEFEVIADLNEPGATAIGGALTCQTTSVQLLGGSGGGDVTYTWTGPGITAANQNQQSPTIQVAGTYVLTVTGNDNGCTSSASAQVTTDGAVPVITATGGEITCTAPVLTLESTSNFNNSTFTWTGPGGFFSTDQNPSTTFAGTYNLVVTNPAGCSSAASVVVIDNAQPPVFSVPFLTPLNCNTPCLTVQILPITPGLVIDPITVCDPGPVSVTITGPNGCTAVASFTVEETPGVEGALEPAFVDCDGSVTISVLATGGKEPYGYLWSNGTTFSSALYTVGSTISVTVTDADGCTWISTPVVIPVPTPLTIGSTIVDEVGVGGANGAINLNLTGGTPPFSYLWSNGATTEDVSGLTGGSYTVTITEVGTGCTTEASFTVQTTVDTKEAQYFKNINVSPNPASGLTALSVELTNAANVTVEMRDALGRMVWSNPTVSTQSLQLPIDVTQQAPGVYNISLIVDNQVFVRKLVVVR